MRLRLAGLLIVALAVVTGSSLAASIPPGRQHLLTIDGENTVTFVPQANLPDFKIEYQAKFEYIVDSRYGKEPKPAPAESDDKEKDLEKAKDDDPAAKPVAKSAANAKKSKSKAKKAENPASKATGAIDVSLHTSQRVVKQNGQPVIEMKVGRSRFQGRAQPEMPIVNVTANEAPLPLQEIMKGFDVIAASLLLDDNLNVVSRKYFRADGPQRALVETMLSIHTPLPRNLDTWESPTQLLMGQGQTAKGMLRFEKIKPAAAPAAASKELDKAKEKEKAIQKDSTLVKVKVSGVLKAEGVVVGRFIKDGTFTVTGEQTFDTRTHDWVASKWSVVIDNELANPGGPTIARAKGTMTLQSKVLDGPAAAVGPTEGATSKP